MKPNSNKVQLDSDVELWLEITGFHDKEYRDNRLNTHKRRAQLEARKRALEQEFADLEHEEALSAQTSAAAKYLRAQSTLDMPPPSGAISTVETAKPAITSATSSSVAGIKRPLSPSNASNNGQPEGKMSRLDTSGRPGRADASDHPPISAGSGKGTLTNR